MQMTMSKFYVFWHWKSNLETFSAAASEGGVKSICTFSPPTEYPRTLLAVFDDSGVRFTTEVGVNWYSYNLGADGAER